MATVSPDPVARTASSWTPLIVVALAQILLVFNSTILKVCIEAIADSFATPSTTVKTAMVAYSLFVAGFIMLGAKIAQRTGARRVFRVTVVVFGLAMLAMTFSFSSNMLLVAQIIAGVASAVLLPTLVMLISASYRGGQQTRALGWLGGVQVMGIVPAFLIAGALATWMGWRVTFAVLVVLSATVYFFSDRLAEPAHVTNAPIDTVGVALAALAILFIGIGCNNLQWGLFWATPSAPFRIWRFSPTLLLIAGGIFLIQLFFIWTRRCQITGRPSLIAPAVLDASQKRRWVLFSVFAVGVLGSAITFVIPLYIEVVQGRNSLHTAIAIIPFTVASFFAALLVIHVQTQFRPSSVARYGYLAVAIGSTLLGLTIHNDWSNYMVIVGMIIVGVGEGALATLLFNVLITTAPQDLAADVEPLSGTTEYLAAGVGIALAGALVMGLLSSGVHSSLANNSLIPGELREQINLDKISFVRNDQLREALARTNATGEQIDEAVKINTNSQLRALRISFFTLAALALFAFFPARSLPDHPFLHLPPAIESEIQEPRGIVS